MDDLRKQYRDLIGEEEGEEEDSDQEDWELRSPLENRIGPIHDYRLIGLDQTEDLSANKNLFQIPPLLSAYG
jgi:hypothetical protein